MQLDHTELQIAERLARAFARSTGIDADDLYQTACLALLNEQTRDGYDPGRCAYKTWINTVVASKLKTYVERCNRAISAGDEAFDFNTMPDRGAEPADFIDFLGAAESLPPLAKAIAAHALEQGERYVLAGSIGARALMRNELGRQGWRRRDVDQGIREVRQMLRQRA